jgi:hypothetical protein
VLDGDPARAALVFPVKPGTALDGAASAASWLAALDGATAVRVLPPDAPVCDVADGAIDGSPTRFPAAVSIAPHEVAELSSYAELVAFADSRSLVVDGATQAALEPSSGPYVALVYSLPGGLARTEAVRESSPADAVDRGIDVPRHSEPTAVTLFVLDVARTALRGLDEFAAADVGAVWLAALGHSDYVERRGDLLAAGAGSRYLIEATGAAPLFDPEPLPAPSAPIQPAVDAYVDGAVRGSVIDDPEACLTKIDAVRASDAPLGRACAPGTLANVADPTGIACVERWRSGELDPDLVRCDGADDLALAFSGRRLDGVVVTRVTTVLGANTPDSFTIDAVAAAPVSPVIRASSVDGAVCSDTGAWTGVTPGSGPDTSGGSDTTVIVSEGPEYYYVDHTSESCACGTSSSENDGCSSDTSSSSEDCSGSTDSGGDGCSSDSSDQSSEDCSSDSSDSGDGCSSDSSSESGDGCSGDSSGSDSGGADCSGSTDSAGDGCSANGESGGCSLSRLGHRRPRLSLLTFIMSVIVLPIRRATSKRRTAPSREHCGRGR